MWQVKMTSNVFYGEISWTNLSFSHSESEFVWEVPLGLKISKFEYPIVRMKVHCWIKVQSDLFHGEICWAKLDNSDFALFPIQVPRAKFRFEVLFKKLHPRIYLTTLFLTKIQLLITIKPFSDHENWSLGPDEGQKHVLRFIYFQFWSETWIEKKIFYKFVFFYTHQISAK
jgi:hypothetical protein